MERLSVGVKGLGELEIESTGGLKEWSLRLAESDLNPGEAGLAEDSTLDILSSHCILEGESPGQNASPPDAVDRGPHDAARGEVFHGLFTDVGQESVIGWSLTGRISRTYGFASGPWRFGQTGPVLKTQGAPLGVP